MNLYTFVIDSEIYKALFFNVNDALAFFFSNIDDGADIEIIDIRPITATEAYDIKGLETSYVKECFELLAKAIRN